MHLREPISPNPDGPASALSLDHRSPTCVPGAGHCIASAGVFGTELAVSRGTKTRQEAADLLSDQLSLPRARSEYLREHGYVEVRFGPSPGSTAWALIGWCGCRDQGCHDRCADGGSIEHPMGLWPGVRCEPGRAAEADLPSRLSLGHRTLTEAAETVVQTRHRGDRRAAPSR